MGDDERVPPLPKALTIRVRPQHYLKLAHDAISAGDGGLAIKHYIQYIRNLTNPEEIKLDEQINLTKLVMTLNDFLNSNIEGIEEEIMKCYLAVINIYPQNALLSNSFGAILFSQGEYNASRKFLKAAADAGFLPGEKNYLHVIWHLIPRWHFRMLNDRHRNEYYQKAITKAIKRGFRHVYDIGAGAGLLSLIALKAHEDVQVVAFEENKTLSDVATKVFKLNNVSERVKLLTANSRTFNDPPDPCELIVTEVFDAGVFGEDCLETIHHAVKQFGGGKIKIIPAAVKVFVTGFESFQLAKKVRVFGDLPEIGLPEMCIIDADKEPYDSDFLKPRKDVRALTKSRQFLALRLYDINHLTQIREQDDFMKEIELVCTNKGTVYSLAVWFDLFLDDETVISTHPYNEKNKCWEQAVFYLDHPIEVDEGDTVRVKPRLVEGRLNFEVLSPKTTCKDCFKVNREVITFLNDKDLIQSVIKASEDYTNCDNLKVLDLNPFPLFGFLMAKKGATVFNIYKDENDLNLFTFLRAANNLLHHKMVFVHEDTVQDYMVYVEKPDIIFRDLIHVETWEKEFTFHKESLNCEFLPRKLCVYAQLVSSEYLDFCNRVDDSNAFGYKIAEVMNEYSGTEHPNFENPNPEDLCSDVVKFDISDFDKIDFHAEGVATRDADCNGILYWFELQITNEESRYSMFNSVYAENYCMLLHPRKHVNKYDVVQFHVLRYEGQLKVYCD